MAHNAVPQINFRPWRQEILAEKNRQFGALVIFILVLSSAIVFALGTVIDSRIAVQNKRNDYISSQTRLLDKQLKEIKDLRTEREDMLERMKIIQSLQGDRPVSVRVFDELVRVVPDGVFFDSLSNSSGRFTVQAIAESNNNVSDLMRSIDNSQWFKGPNLTEISANRQFGEFASSFKLSFSLDTPDVAEGEGE